MDDAKQQLERAIASDNRAERMLRVAAVISEVLSAAGESPVLVGGGAVEIYTRSAYTTRDLDFVAVVADEARQALASLGFERQGRHWVHANLGLVLEFPSSVLFPARAVSIEVDGLTLHIIAVEDLIVDRMASWKHWGWDPDGAAAVILLAVHPDLDGARLKQRAADEEVDDVLEVLSELAREGGAITVERLRRARTGLRGESNDEGG